MKNKNSIELNKFLVNVFEPTEIALGKKEINPIDLIFSIKEVLRDSIEKLKGKVLSDTNKKTEGYYQIVSDFFMDTLLQSSFIIIRHYSLAADNTGLVISQNATNNLKDQFKIIITNRFEHPLLVEIFIENFILSHIIPVINAIHTRRKITEYKKQSTTKKNKKQLL